jgi:hypothetical protein
VGVEVGTVVGRFVVVFLPDLADDRDGLGVVELGVVVERLVGRLVALAGMVVIVVMVVVMVVMPFSVIVVMMVDDGTSAVFTHISILVIGILVIGILG